MRRTTTNLFVAFITLALATACGSDGGGTDTSGGQDVNGGVDATTDFITGWDIIKTDLPGTDIPGVDIPGTDIPGTDIPGVDIPGTDIPGVDIPGTDTTDPNRKCTDAELATMATCIQGCPPNDTACQGNCLAALSTDCQTALAAFEQCAQASGCGQTDVACAQEKCPDQWAAVFGDTGTNPDVAAPYGNIALDFETDYVRNSSDGQTSPTGVVMSAFATGTFGKANASVQPAGASQFQSYAMYMVDPQLGAAVQVLQIGVSGMSAQNPAVVVAFPADQLQVGPAPAGAQQGDVAQIMVVDINWATQQIACVHAFAVGSLNVTEVGDVANHGGLAFDGTLDLFHPTNIYDQDISGQLPTPTCLPQ